VITKVSLILKI